MRKRQPRPRLTHAKSWFSLLLFFLLLFYLLFIWYLERISLSHWLQQFSLVMFQPAGIRLLFELFWRIFRHFIPVIVGGWFAYKAAILTIDQLYDLSDKEAAGRFLSRLRSPMSLSRRPMNISRETLERDREQSAILGIGGPGKIAILPGNVAVTEVNGRKARILPPGRHILSPYEYVHTILDLQEQERTESEAKVRTKDNIDVTASFTVLYRIKRGENGPTKSNPFPFDEEAVQAAAYAQTVLADGNVSTWESKPISTTRSKLAEVVAKYNLDELMHPVGRTDEPYRTLQREVLRIASGVLARNGIELLSVHIRQMLPQKEVEDQYIAFWRSQWGSRAKISEAEGEAKAIEEIEIAKAEAEVVMIQAILEGIQRARLSGATTHASDIVALRLIEGLERMAATDSTRPVTDQHILKEITQLRAQLSVTNMSRNTGSLEEDD